MSYFYSPHDPSPRRTAHRTWNFSRFASAAAAAAAESPSSFTASGATSATVRVAPGPVSRARSMRRARAAASSRALRSSRACTMRSTLRPEAMVMTPCLPSGLRCGSLGSFSISTTHPEMSPAGPKPRTTLGHRVQNRDVSCWTANVGYLILLNDHLIAKAQYYSNNTEIIVLASNGIQ